MVRGRKTLCEQYKPYLVSIFKTPAMLQFHLPMIFIRRRSSRLLLMMCCDGFCGKHVVTLYLAQKIILQLAITKFTRYVMRTVVTLRRNAPDCVNTGEVLGGSNFIIQVVITTPPRGGLSLLWTQVVRFTPAMVISLKKRRVTDVRGERLAAI